MTKILYGLLVFWLWFFCFESICLIANGQNSEPHQKTKLCNPEETVCTDVTTISGVNRARVEGLVSVVPAATTFANKYFEKEITVTTKTKTVMSGSTYTVPAGKKFALTSVSANYDIQAPMLVRLEKQTGGVGDWVTVYRITLKIHGQDQSAFAYLPPLGIDKGAADDVFRLTYESALAKGSLFAEYSGVEY